MPLFVLHADFRRIAREAVRERGDKRVDRTAPHDGLNDLTLVGAEHTPLVGHFDARGFFAHEVDQARRAGAEERILAVDPKASHVIVPRSDFFEQLGDFLGRILQIRIQGHDHLTAHPLKRRHDRHVLTVIAVEIDHPRHVGSCRMLCLQ